MILTIVSYRIVVRKGNRRYDLGHQRSLEPNHLIGLDHVQLRIICVFFNKKNQAKTETSAVRCQFRYKINRWLTIATNHAMLTHASRGFSANSQQHVTLLGYSSTSYIYIIKY